MKTLCSALALVLSVLAPGCGGGGGGGSSSPTSLLAGSYHYLHLAQTLGAVISESGSFRADGAGSVSFEPAWQTGDGAGFAITRASAGYAIDDGRTLSWNGGFPNGLTGTVSAGGGLGHACTRTDGREPGLLVFARRDTSPALGDVAGSWHLVEWRRTGPGPSDSSCAMADVSIDATGRLTTGGYFYNLDGDVNPIAIVFPVWQVTIGGAGWLVLEQGPSTQMIGGLSADGNLILLGGHDYNGGRACLRFLVRRGLAAGGGALSGTWRHAGWSVASSGHAELWGRATFDGVDAGTLALTARQSGPPTSLPLVSFQYGVSVEGQASLLRSTNAWAGGAGDGIVVLAGDFTPLGSRILQVLIR